MSDRFEKLGEVFRNVFEDDDLRINRETSATDVEGWDSLTHVTLLLRVEKAFGVKFRSSEVASLKNAGELADLIDTRLDGR